MNCTSARGKTSNFNGSAVPAQKNTASFHELSAKQLTLQVCCVLSLTKCTSTLPSKKCCNACNEPLSHGLLLQECQAAALESTSQDRCQECNVVVGQLTLRGILSFWPQRLGLWQVRRHYQNQNGLSASYTDVPHGFMVFGSYIFLHVIIE